MYNLNSLQQELNYKKLLIIEWPVLFLSFHFSRVNIQYLKYLTSIVTLVNEVPIISEGVSMNFCGEI